MTTRPPIERMMHIASKLMAGEKFNAATLSAELEVSEKSIHRDIEFMRDRLGYEIEWQMDGIERDNWTFAGRPPRRRVL